MNTWTCQWCYISEDNETPCRVLYSRPYHTSCAEEAEDAAIDLITVTGREESEVASDA